jgi:hypothetical protein
MDGEVEDNSKESSSEYVIPGLNPLPAYSSVLSRYPINVPE